MTAKSTLMEDVMIHGVRSGAAQFASIGFKEAALWSKTVHFYIIQGWMTAPMATEAEPGTAAGAAAAAVDRGPGDSSGFFTSMTYMAV